MVARVDDVNTKVCTCCKIEKDVSSFYLKSSSRKDGTKGYRPYCKDCDLELKRDRYYNKGGKLKQKQRSFKSLVESYGLTLEQYEQERIKHNYACAICGDSEENQPHKRLHIDHCHNTGKYRGLLCNNCNTGLGMFNDDVKAIKKARDYINENRIRHRD